MPEPSPARIFRIILQVDDGARAVDFYRHLLGQAGERVSGGRHYFDCGGVILAIFDPAGDGDDFAAVANAGTVFFAVDDLDAYFERARSAGCSWLDDAVRVRGWGERSFYARDPMGNSIAFVDDATLYTQRRASPE